MTSLRLPSIWVLGALVACNASKPQEKPEQAKVAAPALSASAVAPLAASAEPAAASLEQDQDGWVEVFSYRLKASRFQRCPKDEGPTGGAEPGSFLLGVTVHVRAKFDELLVAARDFTLEKDGVILSTEIDPKPCGGSALLKPRQLKRGQVASGVVVFRVPQSAFVPSATLAYRATRWGGAPRAALAVPACWPDCPSQAALVRERAQR